MTSSRVFATITGIVTGLSGAAHGLFEMAQGNRPTGGLFMDGMGALSILPNYYYTGLAAAAIGIATAVWCLLRLHQHRGPLVFAALSIALVLVGGGVALIAGIIVTSAVAGRMGKPLSWWRRVLPPRARKPLSRVWLSALATGYAFLGVGVAIWLFVNPPGAVRTIGPWHYACWSSLVVGFLLLMTSVVAGFARDIERGVQA